MSEKENGGPAFPFPVLHGNDSPEGMSLRDYFAVHASDEDVENVMHRNSEWVDIGGYEGYLSCKITRQQARYIHADAMLQEREK